MTEQDLQEWNSHPVTRAIFSKIAAELEEARKSSTIMPTVDETALRTAHKEGFLDGANALLEAYETALEEAE